MSNAINPTKSSFTVILDNLRAFIFSLILFGYGVISFLVTDASVSRMITVPYRGIILGVSSFLLAATFVINILKKKKIFPSKITLLLTVFILIYSIRLLYEVGFHSDMLVRDSSEYLLYWFSICLIPGLTFLDLNKDQSDNYRLFSWLFLCAISLLSLTLDSQSSGSFGEAGRLAGQALNPISVGHYATSLVLVSLNMFFTRKKAKSKNLKLIGRLSLFPAFLGTYIVFLSSSRGPLIALILCCTILFLSLKSKDTNIIDVLKTIATLAVIYLAINFIFTLALQSDSSFVDRMIGLFKGDDFDDTRFIQRPELIRLATQQIIANLEGLVFGSGIEVLGVGYPHNLLVDAFLSTGIIGGLIFTFVYIDIVIKAIHIATSSSNSWNWLGILCIQQSISVMFSGALYASNSFWYTFFAIAGMSATGWRKKVVE